MDQNKLEQNALIEKAIVGILGIPRISANSNVSRSPTHEHSKEFDPNEHKSSGKLLGNSQMGGTTPSTTSSAHEHLESSLPSEHQINGELMDNARSDSEPAGLAHNMQLSENASYIFEPATGEEINLGTDIIEILVDMPMCNVEESLLDSDYANILEVSDNSIRPDTTLSLSENSEPSSQCVSSGNQFNLVPTEYVTVEDIESFNNTLTFNSYCGDNCYLPSSSKNCLNDSSETIYSSEILVNGTSTPEKGSNQTEVEVTYEERNTSFSDNSVSIISNDGLIELPEVWDKGHDDTEVDVIIEDNNSPNLLKSDSLKIFYEMNAQLIASDNEESANIGDKYIPILNNKTNDDKAVSADHEDKDMPKLLAVTEIPPVQEIYANPPILKPQVPASKNDVQPKTSVVGVVHPFNRASTATKSEPFSDTTVSQQVAKNQRKLETIEDDKLKQNNVRIRVRTRGNQQTSLNVLVKNFPPEVQVKQGISQNFQRKGYNCNKNEKNPLDENLIYSKHSKKVIENNIFFTGNAKSDESKSNFNNVHWYSVDYETCNTKASLKGSTGMKVTFSSLPDLSIDNDAEQGPVNNSYGEKSSAKTNVQSTRKFSGPLLRSQQRLDLSKEIPPIRNKSGKNAIKNILALGKVKVDDSAIKLHHSEGKVNNVKTAKHYGITDFQLNSSSNLQVDRKSTNTREFTKKDTNTNLASIAENKVRTRTSHRRNSLINNSLLKEHDYFATKKVVSKSKITELVSPEEKIISERSSLSGNKERSLYQDSVDHQLISSIFSKNFCSKNVIVERVHGYESPSISTLPSKDHSSSSNFNSFQAVDSPLNAFDTDSSIHSYIDNSTDTVTKEALLSLSDLELYNDINELKSTEDFRKLDSDLCLNSSNIVSNDDDKKITGVCNEEKRYPEHEDFPIEPEYHENGQAQRLNLSQDAVAIPLPSSNTTSIEYPKKNKPRQKLNSKKNFSPSGDSCIPEMTKSSRVSKPLTKSTRPAPKKSYKKTPTSETLILDSDSYNLSFCDPSALSFSSEGARSEDRSNFANSYDSSSCLSYSMNGPLQGNLNLQTSPVDFFVKSDTLTKSPQDTEVRISESPDIEGLIISPEVILTVLDGTISNSITEDNGENGEILETNNDNLITKVDSTIENMISYDTEITEVVNSSKNTNPTITEVGGSFDNISIPFGLTITPVTITPVDRPVEKSIPVDIGVTELSSIAEKIICTDFMVSKNGNSNQISSHCTINEVSGIPVQSHSSRNTSVAPEKELSVDNLKPVQNLILPVEQIEMNKIPSGSKIEVIAQNLRLSKQHLNDDPLDLVVPKNKITNNKIPRIESNEWASLPLDNNRLNEIPENGILTKQSEMSVMIEKEKHSISDLLSVPLTNIKQNNDQTLHGETANAVEMCISSVGSVKNIKHTLLNENLGSGILNKETQNQVVVIESFKNVKLSILDENNLCDEEVINVERTTEVLSAVIEEEIPVDGLSIVQSPMDLSICHLRGNELQNKKIIDNKGVTQVLPCLVDPEVQNLETDNIPHSDELIVLKETLVNNEEYSSDKQDRIDIARIFMESETEIKKMEIIEVEPSIDISQIVIDEVIQNKETIVDQEASSVLSVLVENKIQILTDIEEQALTDISQIIQTAEMEETIGESCISMEDKAPSIKNSTEVSPNCVFQNPAKDTEIPVECAATGSQTTVKEKVNIEEELSIGVLEKEVKKIPDAEISVGDSVTDELCSVETAPIDNSIIVTEETVEYKNIVIQKLTTQTVGNEEVQIEEVVNVPPLILDNNTKDATIADEQLLSCQNQTAGNKLKYEEVVRNPTNCTENLLQSENSKNGKTAEVSSCKNNIVDPEVFVDKECLQWNKNIPFSTESSSLSEEIVIEPTTIESETETLLKELVESENGKSFISNENISCSNTNQSLADSRLRRKISRKRKIGKYRAIFKRHQLKTNCAKKMNAQKQSSKRLSLYEDKNQKNIQHDNIADSVVANSSVENYDKIIETPDVQQSTSKLPKKCGLFDGDNSATENKECTITDSVNSANDALLKNKKYISEVSVLGTSTIQTKSPCDKINDTPLKSNYIVSGKRIIRIQQKNPILPLLDNSEISQSEKSSQLSAPTCSSNSEILVKNLPNKPIICSELSRDKRQGIIPRISNIVRRNKTPPLCTVELRSETDNQSVPQELKKKVNVLDTCKISKPLPPLIKVDKNNVAKLNKNKSSPVTHENLLEEKSVNEFKSLEEGITLCKLDNRVGNEVVCKVYKDGAKSLNRSDFLSNIKPPSKDKPIPKISKIVRGDTCLSTSLDSSYRVFKKNTITDISIAHKTLSAKGKPNIDCNTVSLSSTKCVRDKTDLLQFKLNHIKPSTSSSSSLDSTFLPAPLAEEVMSNKNLSKSKNLSESKTYVKCIAENTDVVSLTPSTSPTKEHIKPVYLASSSKIVNDTTSIAPDLSAANITISKEPLITTMQCSEPLQEPDCIVKEAEGRAALPTEIPQLTENLQRGTTITQLLPTNDNGKVKNTSQGSIASHSSNLSNEQVGKVMINNKDQDLYKDEISNKRKRSTRICDATVTVDKSLTNHLDDESTCIVKPSQSIEQNNILNPASTSKNSKKLNKNTKPMWSTRSLRSKTVLEKLPDSKIYCEEQYNKKYKCLPLNIELSLVDQCINKTKKLQTEKYVESSSTNSIKRVSYNSKNKFGETSGVLAVASCSKFSSVNLLETELNNEITNRYQEGKRTGSESTLLERGTSVLDSVYSLIATNVSEQDKEFIDKSKEVLPITPSIKNTTDVNLNEEQLQEPAINTHKTFANINEAPLKIPSLNNTVFTEEQPSDFVVTMERDINNSKFSSPAINSFDTIKLVSCNVEKKLGLHQPAVHDVTNNTVMMKQSTHAKRHIIHKEQPSIEVEHSVLTLEEELPFALVKEVPSPICTVGEKLLIPLHLQDLSTHKSECVIEGEISPTLPNEQPSIEIEPSNAIVVEVPSITYTVEEEPLTGDHAHDVRTDKSQCVIDNEISPTLPKEQPSIEVEPSNAIVEEVPSSKFTVEEKPLTPDRLYHITTDSTQNEQGDGISQFIRGEQSSIEVEPSNTIVEEVPSTKFTKNISRTLPNEQPSIDKSEFFIEDRASQTIPIELHSNAEPTSEFPVEKEPSVPIVIEVPSVICAVVEEPLTQGKEQAIRTDKSQCVIEIDISQTIPKEQPLLDVEPSNARVKEVPSPIYTVEEKLLTPDHDLDISSDKTHCLIEDRTSQTITIVPPSIVTKPTLGFPVEIVPSNAIVEEVTSLKFTVEEETLTPVHVLNVSNDKSQSVIEDEISPTLPNEQLLNDVEPPNAKVVEVPSSICTEEQETLTQDHVHDVSNDKSQSVIEDEISTTLPKGQSSIEVEPSSAIVKEVPSPLCTVDGKPLTLDLVYDVSFDKSQCSIEVEPSNTIVEEVPSTICTVEEGPLTSDHIHDVSTGESQCAIIDEISLTLPQEAPSIEVEPSNAIVEEVPSPKFTVEEKPLTPDRLYDITTDSSQNEQGDGISQFIRGEQSSIEVEPSNTIVEEVSSPKFTVEEKPLTPDRLYDITTDSSQNEQGGGISQFIPGEQSSIEVDPSNTIVEEVPSSICSVEEGPLTPDHIHDVSTGKSQCAIIDEISLTLPQEQPSNEVEPSNAIVEEVPSTICTVEEEPLTGDHAHYVSTGKSQCAIDNEISPTLPKEQPSIEVEPSNAIVEEVPSSKFTVEEKPLTPDRLYHITTDSSQNEQGDGISQFIRGEQSSIEVEPSNTIVEEVSSPKFTVEEKPLTPDRLYDITTDSSQNEQGDGISQFIPGEQSSIEVDPSNTIVEEVPTSICSVEEEPLTGDHAHDVSTGKSQCAIDNEISPTLPKEQPSIEVEPSNAIVEEVPSSKFIVEEKPLTPDRLYDITTDSSQNEQGDGISQFIPGEQSSIEVKPSNTIVVEVPSSICTVEEEPLTGDHAYEVSTGKSQCAIDDKISLTLPKEISLTIPNEQPLIEVEPSNAIVEEVPSPKFTVEEIPLTPDPLYDVTTDMSENVQGDGISQFIPREQSSIEIEPSNAIVEEVPSSICTVEERPLTPDHDVSTGKSQCAIDNEISPTLPKEQPSIEVEPSNAIVEEVPSSKFIVEEKPLTPDRLYDITTDSSQNEQGDGISQFIPGEQSSIEVEPSNTIVEEVPSPKFTVEEKPLTPDRLYDITTDSSQNEQGDGISQFIPGEQSSIEVKPSNTIVDEVPSSICTVEEEPLTGDHAYEVSTGKSQCAIDDEISLTLPKEISLTIPNEQPSIEVEPSNAIVEEVPSPKFTVEEIPLTTDPLYDVTTDMSENVQGDGISQFIPREQSSIEIEPSNAIVEEVPSSICTVEERPLTPDHDVSTGKSQYAIDDEISPTLPKEQPSIEVQPSSAIVEEVPSPKFTVEEKPLTPDHLHDVTSDKSHIVHGDSMSLTIPKEHRSMEVEPSNAIVDQVPFPKCTVGEETLTPDHVHDVSSDKSQYGFEDDFSMTLPKEQLSIEVEPSNVIVDEVYSSICTVEEEPLIQGQVHAISNDQSQRVHRDIIPLTILKERRSIDIEPTNSIVKQVPSPISTVEGKPLTSDRLNDVTTVTSQSVHGGRISHFISKEQPSFEVEPSNTIVEEVPSSICTVEEKPLTPDLLHDLTSDNSHNVHGDSISQTFPKGQLSIEVEPSNVIIDEVPSMICPGEEEPSSNAIVKEVPSPLCTVDGKPLTLDHAHDVSTGKSQFAIDEKISPTLPKKQPSIEVEPSNAIVKEVPSPKFTVEEKPLTPDPLYDVTTDMSENVQGDGISQFIPREQTSIDVEPSNAIVEEVPFSICTVEEGPLTPDHIHDVSTGKSQCAIIDEISLTLPQEQPSNEVEPSNAIVEEVPSTICTDEEEPLTGDHAHDVSTGKSQCAIYDEISPTLPKEQPSIEVEPSNTIVEEVPSPKFTVKEKPLTPDHLHDVTSDKSHNVHGDSISPTLLKEQLSIEVEPSNVIVKEVPSEICTVEEEPLTPDHVHDVSSDKSQCVIEYEIPPTLPKELPTIDVVSSNAIVEEVPSPICTVVEEPLTADHVLDISSDMLQCVHGDVISLTIPKEHPSIDVEPSDAKAEEMPSYKCTDEDNTAKCTFEEKALTPDDVHAMSIVKAQSFIEDKTSQTFPKIQPSIEVEPTSGFPVEKEPSVQAISTDKSQCVFEDEISLTIPKELPSIDVESSNARVEEVHSVRRTVEEKPLTPNNVNVINILNEVSDDKPQSVLSQMVPKLQSSVKDEPFKQNFEEGGADRYIVENDILNSKVVEQSSTALYEVQVTQSQNVKEFLAVKDTLGIVDGSVVSESEVSAHTLIGKLPSSKSVIKDSQPEQVIIDQKLQPTNDNILVQKGAGDGKLDSLNDGYIQDSQTGSLDLTTTESNGELIADDVESSLSEKTSVEVNGIIIGSGDESYSFYTNSVELDMSYRYSLKCYKPKYSPRRAKPKTAKESDLNKNDIQSSRVISRIKHSRMNANANEKDISQESNVSKSNQKSLKRKIKSGSIGPQTKRSSHSKDFINKRISNTLTDTSRDECDSVIHGKFKKSLSNSTRKRKLVDSNVEEPPTKIPNRATHFENRLRQVRRQPKPNTESHYKKSLQKSKIFTDKEIRVGNSKSDIKDTSGLSSDPVKIWPLSINETNANSKSYLRKLMRKCGVRVVYIPLHVYRTMCPNEIINTEVKEGYKAIYCKERSRNERSPSSSMREEEELQQRVLKNWKLRSIKLQRAKIQKTSKNSITARNISVKANIDSNNETELNVNNIKEQQVNTNNEVHISNQFISRKKSKSGIETDKFQYPNLSNDSLSKSSGEVRYNISELQETSQEHVPPNRHSIEEPSRKSIKLSITETIDTPSTEVNRHRQIETDTNPYNDIFNKSYNENKELYKDEDSWGFLGFGPCLVHGVTLEAPQETCSCSMNGTSGLFYRNYEKKLRLLGLPNSSDLMFPSPNNFPSLMPPPDSQTYDLRHIGDPLPSQSNCNFDPIGKTTDSNTTHSESSSQLNFSSKNNKVAKRSRVRRKRKIKKRRHAVYLCHSGFRPCPPECRQRALANMWQSWDIPFSEIFPLVAPQEKQKVEENGMLNLPAAPIIDHPLEDVNQPGPSGLNRVPNQPPPQEDPNVCSGKATCRCYDCQDLDEDNGR